jgi:peptidoglycan-associated lipoprotein
MIWNVRRTLLALAAVAFCMPANAQRQERPEADVALTYTAVHAVHTVDQPSFWLQGGALEVHATLFRGLGAVASMTGVHVTSNSPQVAPLDLVTAVFGPRYMFTPRHLGRLVGRTSMYVQGLAGEANGFHSVFATGSGPVNAINGTTDSASSLAVQAGGGIDFHLAHRLSVRAVEVDYLRTQLPNGGNNTQNNLRVAAGLVYRFTR